MLNAHEIGRGKRKAPATGVAAPAIAAKRKATMNSVAAAQKSRSGDNHSGDSRNGVANGVVPFVPTLNELFKNPLCQAELLKFPVESYRVKHREQMRPNLTREVRESIEIRLAEVDPSADYAHAFAALASLVLHVQRSCTNVHLVVFTINDKKCVKIEGTRHCGCCSVINNLQTPSARWDDLDCKKNKKNK
jgi:hypothetical protein